jgi:hypothetical protein
MRIPWLEDDGRWADSLLATRFDGRRRFFAGSPLRSSRIGQVFEHALRRQAPR